MTKQKKRAKKQEANENLSAPGERILSGMNALNLNQPQLSQLAKMTQQNLSRIMRTGRGGLNSFKKIAKALNVSPSYLMFGGEKFVAQELKKDNKFPLLKFENIEKWINNGSLGGDDMDYDLIKNEININEKKFMLEVIGNAMEPILKEGKFVVVDPLRKPKNGSLVLIYAQNKYAIREFSEDIKTQLTTPFNKHPPIELTNDIKIIGVIIQTIHE